MTTSRPHGCTRRSLLLFAAALSSYGAPGVCHARSLRSGGSADGSSATDEPHSSTYFGRNGGFEVVGDPIIHEPVVNDDNSTYFNSHRSLMQREDEEERVIEPKEYIRDETLTIVSTHL